MKTHLFVIGAILVTTFVARAQSLNMIPQEVESVVIRTSNKSLAPAVYNQIRNSNSLSSNKNIHQKYNFDKKISNTYLANRGGVSTGGGDTDVIEFLNIANALELFLSKAPQYCPASNCAFFTAYVAQLNENLGSDEKSLVSFTQKNLMDIYGTEKEALFNRDDLSIIVNRPNWRSLQDNPKAKYALVAAEIFGLSGANERYFRVGEISKNIVPNDPRTTVSGNYSATIEQLDDVVFNCSESALSEVNRIVEKFMNEATNQLTKEDVEMFRSDLLIVARMKTRACIMSSKR